MNRLSLDFSLNTMEERSQFTTEYLSKIKFTPTPTELEKISNYILWGKDQSGKNLNQLKEVDLSSKWSEKTPTSLDELKENPAFQESRLNDLSTRFMQKKETFSRIETRSTAPAHLLPLYESLWHEIDTIDLIINFYDRAHLKTDKEIRSTLLGSFSPLEIETLKEKAANLSQRSYLKLRHLIIEKRREQFTIRDSFASPIQQHSTQISLPNSLILGADIPIAPISLISNIGIYQKIFPHGRLPLPSDFSEKDLKELSIVLWEEKNNPIQFDFGDSSHLYRLVQLFGEFSDSLDNLSAESTIAQFLLTFQYYKDITHLTPLQEEVLAQKILHVPNQKIADYINQKYQKTYNANYISTIYHKKVLDEIAATARYHRENLENIFFPENFKRCKDCGRTLLLDSNNFVRKAKAKDGFSARCKCCEKQERLRRQN